MTAISCLIVRVIARASLLQDRVFGGKDITSDGSPEGLPLNFRFSDASGVFSSILRWRTLILVTPPVRGHALSFPM